PLNEAAACVRVEHQRITGALMVAGIEFADHCGSAETTRTDVVCGRRVRDLFVIVCLDVNARLYLRPVLRKTSGKHAVAFRLGEALASVRVADRLAMAPGQWVASADLVHLGGQVAAFERTNERATRGRHVTVLLAGFIWAHPIGRDAAQ